MNGTFLLDTNIIIAAMAAQYDLTLVTRDAHFALIDDLRVENWI